MKKLLLILLTLFCIITPIYADDDETENSGGYTYENQDSGVYNVEGSVDFWPVNDICKMTYNTNTADTGETGIIKQITHSGDLNIDVYNYLYYFEIEGNYFGTYETANEAKEECVAIYDAINDIIVATRNNSDRGEHNNQFKYKGEWYKLNPKSTCKTDCAVQDLNINKEEARRRFFIVAADTPHFKDDWKSERPTDEQEAEDYYEEIVEESIIGTINNPTFSIKLTNGAILGFDSEEIREREKINAAVLNGTSEKISAYQRFGPNISFVPYFGEQTIKVEVSDLIINAITQDKTDKLLDITDVLGERTSVLSTVAYKNRAPALFDLKDGRVDPRINAKSFSVSFFTGRAASIGNLYLGIAKTILSVMNLFLTDKLQSEMFKIIEKIQNGPIWSGVFTPAINIGIMFGILGLIFSLVAHAKKYADGKEDARPFIARFLGNVCILGVLWLLQASPTTLNYIPKKIMDINTKFTARLLTSQYSVNGITDDVTNTSKPDNSAIESAIWRKAIFTPWCRGMFQDEYQNLFTQYYKGNGNKMEQSYQDPETTDEKYYHSADETGNITYDSAGMVGDVTVPLGGDYFSRNWAIFAWSTQSIYHIDSNQARYILVDEEGEEEQLTNLGWPNAKLSPNNNQIYSDTYRWLDAKLNISPGYTYSGLEVYNYRDAKPYKQTFIREGKTALKLAMLLFVMIPTIIKKYEAFIKLTILSVQVIVYGIINLFKEKSFTKIFPNYLQTAKDYFIANFKIILMMNLYVLLADTSFLYDITFIMLCFVIQTVTPEGIRNSVNSARNFIKYGDNGYSDFVDIIIQFQTQHGGEKMEPNDFKENQHFKKIKQGDLVGLLNKILTLLDTLKTSSPNRSIVDVSYKSNGEIDRIESKKLDTILVSQYLNEINIIKYVLSANGGDPVTVIDNTNTNKNSENNESKDSKTNKSGQRLEFAPWLQDWYDDILDASKIEFIRQTCDNAILEDDDHNQFIELLNTHIWVRYHDWKKRGLEQDGKSDENEEKKVKEEQEKDKEESEE